MRSAAQGQEGRVTREPDPTGFDDIVAEWQREGDVPQWPEDGRWPGDGPTHSDESPPTDEPPADDPAVGESPLVSGRALFEEPTARDDRQDLEGTAAAVPPDTTVPADDRSSEGGAPGRLSGSAADPLADEHFVPPEPPPLPRMGPPILVGLTLIVLGLVLVTFPGWVGVPQVYGLPLGLVAIAAGLGWLVLRLWPDNAEGKPPPFYLDDPDDPDGGAVL
jgi:hypothetical protein